MKKQTAVAVRIHFRNDPESLFHELLVSPHELSLLKALIGLSPLKVQMKPLVTEARKTNENLEMRNAYAPMQSLIKKNLTQKVSKLAPSLPHQPSLLHKVYMHYSTKVDTVTETTLKLDH